MLAACSAPVKVDRVDLRTAYEDLNRTALSSNQLSEATRTVLRRTALLEGSTIGTTTASRRCAPRPSPPECAGQTSTLWRN